MIRSAILRKLEMSDQPDQHVNEKPDHHVNEMMLTVGKQFQNFLWSSFLIIMLNVNMATNGKCNCRLNPNKYPCNGNAVAIE